MQQFLISSDVTAWNLPEGAIARLGKGIIANLAFSPDGESLVVATTMRCWLYEFPTMKPVAFLETERGMVSTISFSPNGQWIATSNCGSIIKVWETETQQCTAKIQGGDCRTSQLAFSSDSQYLAASSNDYGELLASESFDGTILLWDVKPMIGTKSVEVDLGVI